MEEMEEMEVMREEVGFMDDYCVTVGERHPSLLEVPFAIGQIPWERPSQPGQRATYIVQGKCGGVSEAKLEIDLWKLELPVEGKPKVLVRRSATGAWVELRTPCEVYLETMKVVLVGAHFLVFAKQSPKASKGDVWRYLRKECSNFKVKPNHKDLVQAFLLCQSVVESDPKLQDSPIVPQFYPSLSLNRRQQSVAQGVKGDSRDRAVRTKGECSSAVPEACTAAECEASPAAVDDLRGDTSSQSTPATARLTVFEAFLPEAGTLRSETSVELSPDKRRLLELASEAGILPPNSFPSKLKNRKPGRSSRRNSSRKRKARNGKSSDAVEDHDWIDEPDVCAFCDDGVAGGQKLLCCDGMCNRSFHPTIYSGRQNKCPTLALTRAAVSVESWICPNCEARQHQCFACGELGSSSTETDPQVLVCAAKHCKRFYHPVCVAKLLAPDLREAEQSDLASRIQSKEETLVCPLHACASCNVGEDKTDSSLCLIKCRRCPIAWHEKCLPEVCRNQLWPFEDGKHVMYCGQHRLDPELQTPKRDHIKFPLSNQ